MKTAEQRFGRAPIFFKALNKGRIAPFQNSKWPPIGKVTDKQTPIVCHSGWHMAPLRHFCRWNDSEEQEIYFCRPIGKTVGKLSDQKIASEQAKLLGRVTFTQAQKKYLREVFKEDGVGFSFGDSHKVHYYMEKLSRYARNHPTKIRAVVRKLWPRKNVY